MIEKARILSKKRQDLVLNSEHYGGIPRFQRQTAWKAAYPEKMGRYYRRTVLQKMDRIQRESSVTTAKNER